MAGVGMTMIDWYLLLQESRTSLNLYVQHQEEELSRLCRRTLYQAVSGCQYLGEEASFAGFRVHWRIICKYTVNINPQVRGILCQFPVCPLSRRHDTFL